MGAVASATSSNANATSNVTCNNKSHHSQGPNEKTVVTDSASTNLNPKSSGLVEILLFEVSFFGAVEKYGGWFSSSRIFSSRLISLIIGISSVFVFFKF